MGAGSPTIAAIPILGTAMAYREVPTIEMQEVIRRWQAGNSQRQIDVRTGLSRDTVHKYVAAAQGEGIARDGPAPTRSS